MAQKPMILVADDEERIRKLIRDFLEKEGYEVTEAEDGNAALKCLSENHEIRLALLDVMMPGLDGYSVCRELRAFSDIPVVMLTAKSGENDELMGFQAGADEYITKPFSPKILMARIGAILKRTSALEDNFVTAGDITVNISAHEVLIEGKTVDLSYKEFELLVYFIKNKGVALSRERILHQVWNFEYLGDTRTIDTHVKKLRSKMGKCGEMIRTVWGMGYKFEVDG